MNPTSLSQIQCPKGQIANSNGIELWYETFGKKEDPAVLLVLGACCQGVLWPEVFCQKLASQGFYVIRYDHRDTGLSSCFDFALHPYGLMDMTKDVAGLLDTIGQAKAHLFGVSLGSMLSELMAVHYPEKVHTITLMASTCDIRPMNLAFQGIIPDANATLSPPRPEYLAWMMQYMKLQKLTDEQKLQERLAGWNKLNGSRFPLDEKINREIHTQFLARMRYPQGIINHITMLRTAASEQYVRETPSKIRLPCVILHGSEDPLFPRDHAEALAAQIPAAKYFFVEGMGHIPGDHFFDFYIDTLKQQRDVVE